MVQIQPKQIANTEAHFVSAELKDNIIEYALYDAEQAEIGSGSLATDGTITEETALGNVLSSLGVKSLEQIEAERIAEEERLAEQARIEAELKSQENDTE